jgi:hypothetical protein
MPDLNMGGPEPYLIWNLVEERLIHEHVYEEHNIKLQVKELKCHIS